MIEIRKWENAIRLILQRNQEQAQQSQRKLDKLMQEPVKWEGEAILEEKPMYFVVKETIAAVFPSKDEQDINKARLVRYDAVLKYTNEQKILNIIVAPTPYKL
jgi:hypothetical protein